MGHFANLVSFKIAVSPKSSHQLKSFLYNRRIMLPAKISSRKKKTTEVSIIEGNFGVKQISTCIAISCQTTHRVT